VSLDDTHEQCVISERTLILRTMRSFGAIPAAIRGGLWSKELVLGLSELDLLLRFYFHLHESGSTA
jgi:hypothetical protein